MIKFLSIADLISLINAFFGFISIIMIFLEEIHLSFSFILIAILADGLDGIVARKTRESELGEYMEAMSDMISLGIAPAFFVYNIYNISVIKYISHHALLIITLIIFLSFSIIRLSSFHVIKEKKFFIGLPSSASTIIIIVLTYYKIDLLFIIPIIIIVSLAMISNIHFPKLNIKMNIFAAILIIITIITGKIYNGFIPIILLLLILLYIIIGPIYILRKI
jgi:CDP-diacylglycerol--serine O-phosphatidyltransferase